jgi:lipopolysaccharide/colanic/teichoic acid biosynthesis glycosyltransferase
VLFAQERLGLGGQRFRLLKFRSMVHDAERRLRQHPDLYGEYLRNDYKLPEDRDPRITRLGRFLRKSSLDELPQLWNVLRGEMTLVGPRPIVPEEIERYRPYADILLSVKPGLTGSWQVSGRSQLAYPARAFLDLDYIARHTLRQDLGILVKTLPAVVRRRGAH